MSVEDTQKEKESPIQRHSICTVVAQEAQYVHEAHDGVGCGVGVGISCAGSTGHTANEPNEPGEACGQADDEPARKPARDGIEIKHKKAQEASSAERRVEAVCTEDLDFEQSGRQVGAGSTIAGGY